MSDYSIITVCSHVPVQNYFCFQEFFKSLRGKRVLGLGTRPQEYGGLGSKPRLLYDAIKSGNVPEKHIIFCDCFDVVFAASPDELFDAYLGFGVPLVISAEKNCFPTDLKDKYDALENSNLTSYKYLNSGMVVGETEAMLAVLESMDAKNIPNDYWDEEKKIQVNPNDQFYYQQEFLKQPVDIVLDRYQILCNTLHSVKIDELDFNEQGIKNIETNTYPCSFHLNGNAKTEGLREPILKHLNLI